MGAIGEDGVRVLNEALIRRAGVTQGELAVVEKQERAELERRTRRFRRDRARIPVAGRTVVVIDDGIATGSTARAACRVARAQGAARVVLAVPVAPPDWTLAFRGIADELICLITPGLFFGIGQFYADFSQTSDEEVIACLRPAAAPSASAAGVVSAALGDDPPDRDEEVEIHAGTASVHGHLAVPQAATGIVVFAHGSGSSRHSPRNRQLHRPWRLHCRGITKRWRSTLTTRSRHVRRSASRHRARCDPGGSCRRHPGSVGDRSYPG
ncbi:MAG: phosphoribosyltransferase [Pseudonocardiaceae bacterium]